MRTTNPKITRSQIRRTLANGDTDLLPVFAVLREKHTSRVDGTVKWCYVAITVPDDEHAVYLKKDEAKELIDLYRLVPNKTEGIGTVYDTSDGIYKKTYTGHPIFCME